MAATLQQLDEQISDITGKMHAILDDADATSGGRLSAEQKAEHDRLSTECDRLVAEKADMVDAAKRREKLNSIAKASREQSDYLQKASRQTEPEKLGRITSREAFQDDPKKGFKDHREFFLSVMNAAALGRVDDPRLKFLAAGADEQSTIADPYGGFLLPAGFSPDIMSVMSEADPIAQYTTKVPMTNAQVPINARVDKNHTSSVSGGFQVYRRVETQSGTSSRQQYEQVVLNASSLFGLAYATEEILARSPVSFAAIIDAGMRTEFPSKMLDERLNGTGVGMFEGVINCPATVSVSKETGQAAATILYENITKMRARCWGYGNAIWLYNHDCLPQLMLLNQAIGTSGAPVWQPSAREDAPDMLFGRPAIATEYTQTLGTVGDIVLGNWTQYLEGTLTPIQSAESMHVRFEQHERTFKFWTENDGRCWWRSALTPKRSSSTLSPFVTLATRS